MPTFDTTSVWRGTLAVQEDDLRPAERERLRGALLAFSRYAGEVLEASEAAFADMLPAVPSADALWSAADLLVEKPDLLTPAEAFVLGCAFSLYSVGLGIAALPESGALTDLPIWHDTVAALYRREGVSLVDPMPLRDPKEEIRRQAVPIVLRQLYTQRSSELALLHRADAAGQPRFFLPDEALRQAFGAAIGHLCDSVRWPLSKVADVFAEATLSEAGLPPEWPVDPLKVVSLFRAAVTVSLGGGLMRALREALQLRRESDRLVASFAKVFGPSDAEAWWQIYDGLVAVDAELRQIDSRLTGGGRPRLAVIGVAHLETPSRLAGHIAVRGWQPVDAQVRISAVADLVTKLGGRQLYGESSMPPLRELIQNAADAVRAQRAIERSLNSSWGEITIRLGEDDAGKWIEVEDTGIGMSEAVLTGPFLDFGTSFWGSSLMHQELPGLEATGFQSVGRYGIGFFSVFMWGDHVQVVTRRYSQSATLVLEFARGLEARPLLRPASEEEGLARGGTRVRIWWKDGKALEALMKAGKTELSEEDSLALSVAKIAPCLDVTVSVQIEGAGENAIEANDWLRLDEATLLQRLDRGMSKLLKFESLGAGINLAEIPDPAWTLVCDESGTVVGRGAIWKKGRFGGIGGLLTVGGLTSCGLQGMVGFLMGKPERAARDAATPLISPEAFRRWAGEERDRRLHEGHPEVVLHGIATVLRDLQVDLASLPVAKGNAGWLTVAQIRELAQELTEFCLLDGFFLQRFEKQSGKIEFYPHVLFVESGGQPLVASPHLGGERWPSTLGGEAWGENEFYAKTLSGAVFEALAAEWGCSLAELVANSSSRRNDNEETQREIGAFAGRPIVEAVTIVRRP